jgi:hypothetical protein
VPTGIWIFKKWHTIQSMETAVERKWNKVKSATKSACEKVRTKLEQAKFVSKDSDDKLQRLSKDTKKKDTTLDVAEKTERPWSRLRRQRPVQTVYLDGKKQQGEVSQVPKASGWQNEERKVNGKGDERGIRTRGD